ncbi:hypothetical protein MRX96_013466 [Rhipicephalus microplus]
MGVNGRVPANFQGNCPQPSLRTTPHAITEAIMEQPSYTSLLASPQEMCASVRDSDNEEANATTASCEYSAELLIDAIKMYPYLCDKRHPSFKDRTKKDPAWAEIGSMFSMSRPLRPPSLRTTPHAISEAIMEQPSYTSLLASPQEQCASVRDSDNEEANATTASCEYSAELLIDAIKMYPYLCDKRHPSFKDRTRKDPGLGRDRKHVQHVEAIAPAQPPNYAARHLGGHNGAT